MNFQLITELPLWYIIPCMVLGAAYAFVLYYREKTLSDISLWVRIMMSAFRFVTVSFLAFLLLTPLLKTIFREIEKPIIIVAQDNSKSIVVGKDTVSQFYKNKYPKELDALINNLKDKYTVKEYSFGDGVKDNIDYRYNEQQTNISELFDEIYSKYSNRNIGAIIVASDGLYNQGSNPVYASEKLKVPVYTIALGDTTVQKDIVLTKVNYNKIAYLGNNFPLEIMVDAKKCKGNTTVLTLSKDSSVLFKKTIDIPNSSFHAIVPVSLEANTKGIQHYKIQLSTLADEISKANNTQDIFIEVLENKQKILVLANSPHPDLAALKQSIESSQNYEVKIMLANDIKPSFEQDLKTYNLIILHQLPSIAVGLNQRQLEKIIQAKIPLWYILGTQVSISSFNNLQTGLTIAQNINKMNDAQPFLSGDFSLFTLSDETVKMLNKFPPLLAPFGTYRKTADAYPLLLQQLGSVKTEYPLLLFTQNGEVKIGILAGEGIWKWQLQDFTNSGNHNAINELLTKVIQYLSAKEDKRPFRIIGKNSFQENEPVRLDAEVHNESFELIISPEVRINIINHEKKNFPFTFNKTEKAYTLNAGYFPVGSYNYQATVKIGDKLHTVNGEFSVSPLQLETSETVADHQLLYSLATKHNGEMLFPNELDKLAKKINAREDIKSVSYSQKQLKEMLNLKTIFFILLLLLSAEWFLRKRNGGY